MQRDPLSQEGRKNSGKQKLGPAGGGGGGGGLAWTLTGPRLLWEGSFNEGEPSLP